MNPEKTPNGAILPHSGVVIFPPLSAASFPHFSNTVSSSCLSSPPQALRSRATFARLFRSSDSVKIQVLFLHWKLRDASVWSAANLVSELLISWAFSSNSTIDASVVKLARYGTAVNMTFGNLPADMRHRSSALGHHPVDVVRQQECTVSSVPMIGGGLQYRRIMLLHSRIISGPWNACYQASSRRPATSASC